MLSTGHFKALIPGPTTISDGWFHTVKPCNSTNEQWANKTYSVPCPDQRSFQRCIISGFPASERTYDFTPCYCLFSFISSDLPFKCSCLSYWDPKRIKISSPSVRIRFHFLSTFPTMKKTVVFNNIIKGISLNTRLKLTSFPFPEFSVWSNHVWYTLKGLKNSDHKKHVLLQVCTIWSQDNRCIGATQINFCRHLCTQ